MKLVIPKGATSRIVTVFIQANNVTTGAGLSGLTNASSIVGGYVREGGTGVALAVDEDVTTEGTYQAPSAVGKVRIGTPANMRAGTYELHFHNDLWASGAEAVAITLGGAANMADLTLEVQLSDPAKGLGAPSNLDTTVSSRSSHSAADVWSVATRVLTAGTNIALAKGTGVTGFNDLDAAGIRTAVGLSSANLATLIAAVQTVVDAIKLKTDNLPNDPADASDIAASIASLASTLATILGHVDTEIASIKAKTDNLPTDPADESSIQAAIAAVAAAIAALNNLSSAQAQSASAAALAAYDGPTNAEMEARTVVAASYALEATLTAIKGLGWATETLANLSTRLPTALTAGGHIKADMLALNGVTAAAARLAKSAGQIIPGTVDNTGHTPTSTVFEADDITEATADHFIGRVVLWTTGALAGQATTVTDYALVSGRGRFTVDAMTEAPANNDEFVLI